MAKVQYSAIGITNISGKSGGSVFAFNKGGSYVRRWAKPTNPQTDKQTALRSIFSYVTKKWGTLQPQQVEAWKEYAKSLTTRDAFGESRPMTGFSAFVRANQNRLHAGFDGILLEPMIKLAMPSYAIDNVSLDLGGSQDITFVFPDDFEQDNFILSIGVCVVPIGSRVDFGSVKHKFGYRLRVPAVPQLVAGKYQQIIDLGTVVDELSLQVGQIVYFQVHMHSVDGQKSNEVTYKETVVEL